MYLLEDQTERTLLFPPQADTPFESCDVDPEYPPTVPAFDHKAALAGNAAWKSDPNHLLSPIQDTHLFEVRNALPPKPKTRLPGDNHTRGAPCSVWQSPRHCCAHGVPTHS